MGFSWRKTFKIKQTRKSKCLSAFDVEHAQCLTGYHVFMVSGLDLARAPRRAPLTARKKGSGYENGSFRSLRACEGKSLGTRLQLTEHPRPQAQARAALTVALGQAVDLRRNSDAEAWSHSIILVPRALLTRGQPSATRGSGQIQTGYHKNMVSG